MTGSGNQMDGVDVVHVRMGRNYTAYTHTHLPRRIPYPIPYILCFFERCSSRAIAD
ncbi:hypothetical protein KIN20_022309 [Parelaphostrongylus tenuis]|uniref:Uncharacterized protein n=1 Tax=Parelaphostrongylus tenuis TaxID=148309 RepID=A0AAD5QUP3_PARTN|nr:hypothetical protein KIN20_022309 [Parelaphostrongylus tenuis]